MVKHWQYLNYVLRHKWFVFLAGLKTGAPLWRLIIHDWSKFLPREWKPYVDYFYGDKDKIQFDDWSKATTKYGHADGAPYGAWAKERFNIAWNIHQNRNPHHWQYWVLIQDNDEPRYFPVGMPDKFIKEMVADWAGAGRAITGKWEVSEWYMKNRLKMIMRGEDHNKVEELLAKHFGLNELVDKTSAV